RLIAHVITSPLRWLGAAAVGKENGATPQIAFRVSPMGLAFLDLASPEPQPEESGTFTLDQDYLVRASTNANLYDLYQLERFTKWQGEKDGTFFYHLTRASVWRGRAQGIEVRQMIAFLRRVTVETLPDEVAQAMEEWGNRYGKITLREAILLQTPDAATMHQLREQTPLADLLREQLSPCTILVDEGSLDLVVKQLKQMGHWPQVEGKERRGKKGK
ncbi:MAG: helicase-associated domain-containing protein, partial [Anaerolineae bacterium]|nr:helicase-associated domain-containing protein [Anaerolineae bacterium]